MSINNIKVKFFTSWKKITIILIFILITTIIIFSYFCLHMSKKIGVLESFLDNICTQIATKEKVDYGIHLEAAIWLAEQNLSLAIQEIQKSINMEPKESGPYLILGGIYYSKHLLDKSAEVFKKGSQIDPTEPRFFFFLGEIYEKKGDFDEALMMYKKALECPRVNIERVMKKKKIEDAYNRVLKKSKKEIGRVLNHALFQNPTK